MPFIAQELEEQEVDERHEAYSENLPNLTS